jgi:single-strand DNA-binding protein
MPSFNRVILAGNLTRDPELRYLNSGSGVCEFAIAINRKWKDKDGSAKEEVSFFDCVAWAKTGEVIAEYFKKGRPILIEGRLQQDRWEDKATGQNRSRVRIVVDRFEFLGSKQGEASETPPQDIPDSDPNVPF